MARVRRAPWILTALLAACSASAAGQASAGGRPGAESGAAGDRALPLTARVGSSHLALAGVTPSAQRRFDQGLSLLHGFWESAAVTAFAAAAAEAPASPMPHVGRAIALNALESSEEARAAIEAAQARAAGAPARDRRYVAAVAALIDGDQSRYGAELERIVEENPEDLDARLLLARAAGYGSERGLDLIEQVLAANPDHIGAHHYRIHALEDERPREALANARALDSLGVDAAHQRHMPGHIHAITGDARSAHASFEAAWQLDSAYMARTGASPLDNWSYVHNLSYLVWNLVASGRASEAARWSVQLERLPVEGVPTDHPEAGTYFYQGLLWPAVPALRLARWSEALAALERPELEGHGFGGAAEAYRRGLIAYATGRLAIDSTTEWDRQLATRRLTETIATLDSLVERGGLPGSRRGHVTALRLDLGARRALRDGDPVAAWRLMREAVEVEDRVGRRDPPRFVTPMRERLGRLLLEWGDPASALGEFEGLAVREPGSGSAWLGIGRSLESLGRAPEAREAYETVRARWPDADHDHPVVAEARRRAAALDSRPRPAIPDIDRIFVRWDRIDTPGCGVAVQRFGAPIHIGAYGMADLERGIPIVPETVFDIASISKQFTAAAILILAERGELELDDDVRSHIPELAHYPPITIRELLHHTSGVRDYFGLWSLSGGDIDSPMPRDAVLRLLALQRDLVHEPGTASAYSNSNYFLAAEIVARVTGRPLTEWAGTELFGPLGMNASAYYGDERALLARRAQSYYEHPNGGFGRRLLRSTIVGDGGVHTTTHDLLAWQRAISTGRMGSGAWALADTLRSRGRLRSGERIDYGFGLQHGEYRGIRTIGHGGTMGGYRSFLIRSPAHDLDVAVLCNQLELSPFQLSRRILDALIADDLEPMEGSVPEPFLRGRPRAEPARPAAGIAERYEGMYRSPEIPATWRVIARDRELWVWIGLAAEVRLEPGGEDDLFVARGAAARFVRGSGGAVTGLVASVGRVGGLAFTKVVDPDR